MGVMVALWACGLVGLWACNGSGLGVMALIAGLVVMTARHGHGHEREGERDLMVDGWLPALGRGDTERRVVDRAVRLRDGVPPHAVHDGW